MDLSRHYSNPFCPAVKLISLLAGKESEPAEAPEGLLKPGSPRASVRPRLRVGAIQAAVLIVLGARILLERRQELKEAPATTGTSLAWAYLSTLGLTITNPATIISFVALAATLGLGSGAGLMKPAVLIGGVLLGSVAWWCVLAVAASLLRTRLTPAVIRGVSAFSGLAIAVLGMLAIYSAFS